MRLTLLRRAAFAAALSALALPASALGNAEIQDHSDRLADYDARAGKVAPTRTQRAAVRRLRANVRWNQFGTPATLSKQGKFLAKGVRGRNAADSRAQVDSLQPRAVRAEVDRWSAAGRRHADGSKQRLCRQLPAGEPGPRDCRGRAHHRRADGDGEEGLEHRPRVVVADAGHRAQRQRTRCQALRPGCELQTPSESTATRPRTSSRRRPAMAGRISRSAASVTSSRCGPSRSRPSVPGLSPRTSRSC